MLLSGRHSELSQWILVLGLAYVSADTVAALVEQEYLPQSRSLSHQIEAPAPPPTPSVSQLSGLLSNGAPKLVSMPAAQTKQPAHASTESLPHIVLRGVMAGNQPEGVAFIDCKEKTLVVNRGEIVPGTSAVLEEVHSERIVLRSGETLYNLGIGGAIENSSPSAEQKSEALEISDEPEGVLPLSSRREFVALLDNPDSLQGMRAKSVVVKGEMVGARVTFSNPSHPLARLGLVSGDLVLSVNQRAIDSPSSISAILPILRNSDTLVIEVERAGSPETLTVEFED
jgi:type II secretion system protein C